VNHSATSFPRLRCTLCLRLADLPARAGDQKTKPRADRLQLHGVTNAKGGSEAEANSPALSTNVRAVSASGVVPVRVELVKSK
jgi:hypothetical protein